MLSRVLRVFAGLPRVVGFFAAVLLLSRTAGASVVVRPERASGIYALGETVRWCVSVASDSDSPAGAFRYAILRDGADVIKRGDLAFESGHAVVEIAAETPAMLVLEITRDGDAKPVLAAAAVAPARLRPAAARPADFAEFWRAKLALLQRVAPEPVVTAGESGKAGIDYATIRLNNVGGAHVYGQIAKPAREGKFPALLILQWASPPYPLQKAWVTDRAAEGWLALNVEPHDVPGDLPPAFYAALPQMIRKYETIYHDDRDRNYFLQMYLGDYRAVDYLAGRPDWDGKTLVLMGTSMGGQQSLCVAGLHPRVTHVIVHVPAGCDAQAALHGRAASYPNWDSSNPKVMQTAVYFDPVNFAPDIKATCLVSLGFLDMIARPTGIWAAFNRIASRKEIVPLVDAPHNNFATPAQQRAYTERSTEWLAALVRGEQVRVRAGAAE